MYLVYTSAEEMKEMIATQLAMVATVDNEGNPNIGPKHSIDKYVKSYLFG